MADTKSSDAGAFAIDPATMALIESAEKEVGTFGFERPEMDIPAGRKLHVKLGGTGSCRASVQVLNKGGENNLHYHANMDLIYMVLKGTVAFYGDGDELLGEFGAHQGITLPQYARYWFKSVGDEEAWLLQIAGYPKGAAESRRIPCAPGKRPASDLWVGLTEEEQAIRKANNR